MKIMKTLIAVLAAASVLAFSASAEAQRHGSHGSWHGGGGWHGWHGGWHGWHGGSHVVVGFGFPYYWGGYWGPYWGGYWGYPYGYYGYGYPVAPSPYYYGYDPQGIYQGRLANPPRTTNDGGKDVSMVARVQRHLAETGYYDGEIDGIAGQGTRTAIRHYQRVNGLPVDGRIDDQLLQSMGQG